MNNNSGFSTKTSYAKMYLPEQVVPLSVMLVLTGLII